MNDITITLLLISIIIVLTGWCIRKLYMITKRMKNVDGKLKHLKHEIK